MATQSITNMGSLVRPVENNRTSGSTEKVAVQRQAVAVELPEVETQEVVELSREALEKVVSQLSAYVQNTQRDVNFSVDDSTGRVVVRVIDSESEEIIRQIPSKEMLAISQRLVESLETEQQKGFLIELKA